MCRPRNLIRYFEAIATAPVADVDPEPVGRPPVAVLRPGDPHDERDPVPRQERACGPDDRLLLPERDHELDQPAREDRREDLREREPEVELGHPQHVEDEERRRDVKARVLRRRQNHRIRPAGNAKRVFGRYRLAGHDSILTARMRPDAARAGSPDHRPRRLVGSGPGVRVRRRRPRRDRRRGDDGRCGPGHAAERSAQGLHGRPQRRALDGRACREGSRRSRSSGRASTRSSRSSSAESQPSTAAAASAPSA